MSMSGAYAAELDNATDNSVTDDGSIVLAPSVSTMAFFCWWYPVGSPADDSGICGNWSSIGGNLILFRSVGGANKVETYWRNSASTSYGGALSAIAYTEDAWNGAAFRWNGSSLATFINGAKGTNLSTTGGWSGNSTYDFQFGYLNASQDRHEGRVSQAAFWSTNAAPSDAQIQAMTNGQLHPMRCRPNHFWPFWETSGSTARDWVGGADLTYNTGSAPGDSLDPAPFIPWPVDEMMIAVEPEETPAPLTANKYHMIL